MPWRQVDAMTERRQFIVDARQRLATFTDLCALMASVELPATSGCTGPTRADSISSRSSRGARIAVRTRRRRPCRPGCSRRGGGIRPRGRASCYSAAAAGAAPRHCVRLAGAQHGGGAAAP